jgi:hypothetical protein
VESEWESAEEAGAKVYSFTMAFRIYDYDAYQLALEDLQNGEVWAEGEGPEDNTVAENLEILVEHLDVLADYRERQNIAYTDIGIERVTQ